MDNASVPYSSSTEDSNKDYVHVDAVSIATSTIVPSRRTSLRCLSTIQQILAFFGLFISVLLAAAICWAAYVYHFDQAHPPRLLPDYQADTIAWRNKQPFNRTAQIEALDCLCARDQDTTQTWIKPATDFVHDHANHLRGDNQIIPVLHELAAAYTLMIEEYGHIKHKLLREFNDDVAALESAETHLLHAHADAYRYHGSQTFPAVNATYAALHWMRTVGLHRNLTPLLPAAIERLSPQVVTLNDTLSPVLDLCTYIANIFGFNIRIWEPTPYPPSTLSGTQTAILTNLLATRLAAHESLLSTDPFSSLRTSFTSVITHIKHASHYAEQHWKHRPWRKIYCITYNRHLTCTPWSVAMQWGESSALFQGMNTFFKEASQAEQKHKMNNEVMVLLNRQLLKKSKRLEHMLGMLSRGEKVRLESVAKVLGGPLNVKCRPKSVDPIEGESIKG